MLNNVLSSSSSFYRDIFSIDSNERENYDHRDRGCRALWRGIIMQAIVDAVSDYKRTEYKIAKLNAIQWLQGNSEHFKMVCFLAGYNAAMVRKKSIELIQANSNGDKRVKAMLRFNENS